MSWNITILYTYFRWPLLALGSLGSSSLFQCTSQGTLTRKRIGAFVLGLKNGWVKPIAWFGFCLQDFSRLLSWSLYTPKSCTLCGSHVQSQEDVIIVCNRFETKLKTTYLIPIYSCKKKISLILALQKFLSWSILFGQDSWILATVFHEFLGTLRYSEHGRGGYQPEVKCSMLETN